MKVTVFVANGLQVAALGAYGNEWIATPNLDHLATEAVVFDQHLADAPAAPCYRGRHVFPPAAALPGEPVPAGVAIVELAGLAPPWHLPESLLTEQFTDWEFDDDPHPWLDPGQGWLDPNDDVLFARLQRTYSAAVRQFDEAIGEHLARCPRDDLVIVTACRGQNLGEHGLIGDFRPWLHEELVHLPLLIRLPGGEEAGRRVAHLTQTVDIAPTILEALGLPAPDDWHGHSLLPLCRGAGPVRTLACTGWQVGAAVEYALQTPEVKVIVPEASEPYDPPRPPMYFVKPDDRWEVNDLRQPNLDTAEQLEQTLREYVRSK